jgi:hypothetical protein
MRSEAWRMVAQEAAQFHGWGGRVPIILGVTGHRNIDTKNKSLNDAIRGQCHSLIRSYRHSPFIILSALAEGADRLVARIAMEEVQAQLIAVLPLPAEDYLRDFATEASKAEFNELFEKAFCVRIAATPIDDTSWKAPGEPRNRQYARAGAIIADHAQVLFAVWDGLPARGTGGTADQIAWFDRGYAPAKYSLYMKLLSPLDPPEPGRRIRIDPDSAKVLINEGPGERQGARKSNISSILARTNKFNRDAVKQRASIEKSISLAKGVAEADELAITDGVYRSSDGMSVHFAGKVRQADRLIYFLALIAVLAFNFLSQYKLALWIYLVTTTTMAMLAARVWFTWLDNRFLEFRCLAEAMRTMFFWRHAGIRRPVWLAYLSRQSGVLHWIRHAVRSIEFCQDCLLQTDPATQGVVSPEHLKMAKSYWVDHQMDWFKKKELEHFGRVKVWGWIGRAAFGASFVIAGVLAAFMFVEAASVAGFLGALGIQPQDSLWNTLVDPKNHGDFWQAALGFFAAIGLAARGFLARRADLELTKQYASQGQIFETASHMLGKLVAGAESEWTGEAILERLGGEALQEQAEWLWLRHTRPFEVSAP